MRTSPRRGSPSHRWLGACFSLVLASCAGFAWADNTPENLVVWREGLTSSAQPNKAFLADAKKQGYDLVINLAPPQASSSIANEGGLVAATGARYVNIPVEFGKPTLDDFKFFSDAVKAGAGKKILVHCEVNLRGSSFVFLYRVIHEGVPVNQAMSKLTSIWTPNPTWKKFIEETLAAYGKKGEIL